MDLGLKGMRALVTGSTAGIGLAAARALAEEGAPSPAVSPSRWWAPE
jgi:NAD(P)-dependent dehydrogenase (short-subunit alcohol dehydrogenase family)